MYYELKIRHTVVNSKGYDKDITETFIAKLCETFSDAETKGYEFFNNECDVVSVKRSPIREFANEHTDDNDRIYVATITDVFLKEDGSEGKIKYKVALYADSVSSADKVVREYMRQGLDNMECEGLRKTEIVEVI